MDDYALYVDPDTQKRSYMRFAPRDSEKMGSVDFKNFKFDPENSKSLKFVVRFFQLRIQVAITAEGTRTSACAIVIKNYASKILKIINMQQN